MKRFLKLAAVAAIALTCAMGASAKSWRVNNNASMSPDFLDINIAMASADVQPGDTLYLDPGTNLASDMTVSKDSITIIGPGYFLKPYPEAYVNKITVSSSHVKITGLHIKNLYLNGYYNTLERCRVTNDCYIGRDKSAKRHHIVRQCYIDCILSGSSGTYKYSGAVTIENNIILNGVCDFNEGSIIRNNYIHNAGANTSFMTIRYVTNSDIKNNIIINSYNNNYVLSDTTTNTISNNILSANTGGANNKLLGSSDLSLIFTNAGSNDELYQLKEDSPAKGYATDGGDCGPSGGTTPYVLSGLPLNHPYFTKVSVAGKPTNGKIKVTLNTKIQND